MVVVLSLFAISACEDPVVPAPRTVKREAPRHVPQKKIDKRELRKGTSEYATGYSAVTVPMKELWKTLGVAHPFWSDYRTIDGEKFPELGPLAPPIIPDDNDQKVDDANWPRADDPRVVLGKHLFFDPRLSGDGTVSCATCHDPKQGWALNTAISRGYPGTTHWRNSQTVINTAYLWKLNWDGSDKSLETQAKAAAMGLSGNGKADMMEERLRQCPDYVRMFKDAYGSNVPLIEDAWRAIAAFVRTLNQPFTPYDRHKFGDPDAYNDQQERGRLLFRGKASCVKCHNGAMFTDGKFYNLGVPQHESFRDDPLRQITMRFEYFSKGVSEELYRKGKYDLGLYFMTKREDDIGKFRTPPLRYLKYTAPYMHNGVFETLEEVIEFYNDGGGEDWAKAFGIATKSKRMKPLNLNDQEQKDLIAFLATLSGDEILMEPPELPKYE